MEAMKENCIDTIQNHENSQQINRIVSHTQIFFFQKGDQNVKF